MPLTDEKAMSEIDVEVPQLDAPDAEVPEDSSREPEHPEQMVRKAKWGIAIVSLVGLFILLVWSLNQFIVDGPLQRVLAGDWRDKPVKAHAHWRAWVNSSEVVFDITGFTREGSRLDVLRVLKQYAEAVKGRHYSRFVLASKGKAKFAIDGKNFQKLGDEYNSANPVYLVSVLPTLVSTMDGIHPYHEFEGGLFGVVDAELQQFNHFSDEWYVNDFQSSLAASSRSSASASGFDPCKGLRDQNPHCGWTPHWEDSGVSVSEMDGTKTETLSTDSNNPDGEDFGGLHYAVLTLCFENGKICGGNRIGVGVRVHGMIESLSFDSEYNSAVRIRFDDGTPLVQTWGLLDDRQVLFPSAQEKAFAAELTQHKNLILEFSYFQRAPRAISFDLGGLDDMMKSKELAF